MSKHGEYYSRIFTDIYAFATACKFEPTWQQRQLFDAVMRGVYGSGKRKIAVKSGQGPGKSTASGIVGLWLLLLEERTKLLVTAPTMRQCRDVWLAEIKQTLFRADKAIQRLFQVSETGIGVMGHKKNVWGALLITATSPEALQGQHRKDMHLIVEEASGVPREYIEQFKGTLSNPNALFLQIGNPNTSDCSFYDCFNIHRDKWETFTWNAEETPASEWFDPQRNKDLEEEFGRDSDVYRVRVLGEFPHADPNCVMSAEDIQKCMDRKLFIPCTRLGNNRKQFGIDVARFGGDESVIYRRYGNSIIEQFHRARVDPNAVVDLAFKMEVEAHWGPNEAIYVVDAGGMGQGIMRNFYQARRRLHEFHSAGTPTSVDYANKISQAWFQLAKLVKKQECYLPLDAILARQLSTRQYFIDKKGKLLLESKDQYKDRGFESPDRADAAVLAFWEHATAGGSVAKRGSGRKQVGI